MLGTRALSPAQGAAVSDRAQPTDACPTIAPGDPARFRHVFVVTYGRSGSTLVQGLLNTLPRVLVRGENNFYVLPLFRAQALAGNFQRRFGKKPHDASSAFFGLNEVDIAAFARSAGELVDHQLLGSVDPSDVDMLGFKEVLWHRVTPAETYDFFAFLDHAFPAALYVLNQRDHEAVVASGFWQRKRKEEAFAALRRVKEIQAFLRTTRPARVFDTHYELLTGRDQLVADEQMRGLAEFVLGSCDEALLAALRETLRRAHGPNPFGLSKGAQGCASGASARRPLAG